MKLIEIARALGCELRGDPEVEIHGVAGLEDAGPGSLTFLADGRLARRAAATRASAIILANEAGEVPVASLRSADPHAAFIAAVALLHPPVRPVVGVHATAVLAPTAIIGPGASIGPHVVVGEGVVVGARAVLHARVVIYPEAQVGDDFTAHAGVVVREGVRIGHRVTLHAGAVVGSDGFGYVTGPDGPRKVPQVGTVVLEDDVDVGANATIDRAALGATIVGRGTKIDNLVMVGHNCRIGAGCLLAAQVGLAGSTTVGNGVMMGGQVGVAGHLAIGAGARIAAQSGVYQDVPAGAVMSGYPATDVTVWNRAAVGLRRLPDALRRLRRVERRLGVEPGRDD